MSRIYGHIFTIPLPATLIALALWAGAPLSGHAEAPRQIVFVAGTASHGYGLHEHRAGCLLLARLIEENTDHVTRVHTGGWPTDPEAFDGADAIILFSDGGGGHMVLPHLAALDRQVQRGAGLGVLQYAVEMPPGEPGTYFQRWIGGHYETHFSANPIWEPEFASLPDHPVMRGVQPFSVRDEWYFNMRFRADRAGVIPLLAAAPSDATRDGPYVHPQGPYEHIVEDKGRIETLLWAVEREDGGRGFGFTGGHFHWNWGHPDFRTAVLNAILWVAGAEVPDGGVPTPVLTLEELEAHQDYDPPAGFDRDALRRQLEDWQTGGEAGAAAPWAEPGCGTCSAM
jgi:type 1 glutamine amidotransferase